MEESRTDIIAEIARKIENENEIVDDIHSKTAKVLNVIVRELVRPKLKGFGFLRNSKKDRILINELNELIRIPFKHQLHCSIPCWVNSWERPFKYIINPIVAELVMDHPEFLQLTDYIAIRLDHLQMIYNEINGLRLSFPLEWLDSDDKYAGSIVYMLENIKRRVEEIRVVRDKLEQEIGDSLLKSSYNNIYIAEMV